MNMNSPRALGIMAAVALTGLIQDAAANDVPLNLPRPDGKPGDVKKKVMVIIAVSNFPMDNRSADGFLPASRDSLSVWLEEMKIPPVE
jgi:hypothetical protein